MVYVRPVQVFVVLRFFAISLALLVAISERNKNRYSTMAHMHTVFESDFKALSRKKLYHTNEKKRGHAF